MKYKINDCLLDLVNFYLVFVFSQPSPYQNLAITSKYHSVEEYLNTRELHFFPKAIT